MALPAALSAAIASELGAPLEHEQPVFGGDINQSARFQAGGTTYFVKWNSSAPGAMFPAEARGLQLLAQANAVRVPAVIAQRNADGACPAFLVLEWIETGSKRGTGNTMARFGSALAELHRHTAETHGLDHDNFIGRLPQPNPPTPDWATFYRDHRIGFQMAIARKRGRLPSRREDLLTRLMDRLPDLLDDVIPVSLLHGDLWGGNYLIDIRGEAVIIDPAVYYGHREMDLAMSELFGGFSGQFYDAYHTAYPLDGYDERRALYQLYYILVHLNLFGESYGGRVDSIAAHYVGYRR
ncbi:MAG: fructosamine kinase family protein [Anaerolineae bacterium]|nr:fructosamine kinase family protein [Anaerolineae bacterium]